MAHITQRPGCGRAQTSRETLEGTGMKSLTFDLAGLPVRLIRLIGTATGLSLLLLLAALSSVAYGLSQVVTGLTTGFSIGWACTGIGIGWLLARSRWRAAWSAGMAAVLGIGGLFVYLGDLLPDLITLLRHLIQLWISLLREPLNGTHRLDQIRLMLTDLAESWDKVTILFARVQAHIVGQVIGSPSYDPSATFFLWGLAIWAVAVWAAWAVRRQDRPLSGLTPSGILLAAGLGYSRADPLALVFLLGSAMLLIVLVQHLTHQRRWEAEGTDYSEELGLDLALIAIPMAAMILSAAAFSPNISPRRISQVIQETLHIPLARVGEMGEAMGLRRQPANSSQVDAWRDPGLPRSRLIGSGPELSDEIVMEIQPARVSIPLENANDTLLETARLNYWRSLTYDIYTGTGWRTGTPEIISYQAGELARPPGFPQADSVMPGGQDQAIIVQEFRILAQATELLYVNGIILSADQDYQIAWRHSSIATGPDIFGGLISKPSYQVRSLLIATDPAQLQAAGTEYPAELRARYLALPPTVPQRVQALALHLTATQLTPYERARAIESYLRSFPYELDVPLPPLGADLVDYFLFELQQGYCDYYATAMVVLSRAAGIPARLVMGYAGGTYDPERGVTIVTEAHAHSWAELFFPEIGWVEFEPTSGRPYLDSPVEDTPALMLVEEEEPFPVTPSHQTASPLIIFLGVLLGLALFFFPARQWWENQRIRSLPPNMSVIHLYRRFYFSGRFIPGNPTSGETPYEFAARFIAAMERLSISSRWGKHLAISQAEVFRLTEIYALAVYSPRPTSRVDQDIAIHIWRKMRWRLRLLRLFPDLALNEH